MNDAIARIHAREILDSRGMPTVETEVVLESGTRAVASVPSGASTGQYEAWELRDQDPSRYGGKGVLAACANVNDAIAKALLGTPVTEQHAIDQRMIDLDGSSNKANLGANAILSVSLACARAAALASHQPLYRYLHERFSMPGEPTLPRPAFNVINGGRHADNGLDFQEYMIVPLQRRFHECVRCAAEIVAHLAGLLRMRGLSTMIGDEGGFTPRVGTNREPLQLIAEAISRTPYSVGKDVHFGMDVAASEFFTPEDRRYFLKLEQRRLTADEMVEALSDLTTDYPFAVMEDGMAEGDWTGWKKLTTALGASVRLIGDDLFCTNVRRLERGIAEGVGSGIIIKPNQIGTLTETVAAVLLAQKHRYTVFVSHRSGETNDDFAADLSVAVHAAYVKFGSVMRGERLAKYNRLLQIEDELS